MKQYIIILFAVLSIPLSAQTKTQKIGDFIESISYNEAQRDAKRVLQYYPEGQDFVCVNGKNRFTRALYCNHSAYRIETSDRPVFAIYKPKNYRSVRFHVIVDGKETALDSTDFCEARYTAGKRTYKLTDKSWNNGEIKISVLPFSDREGGIWMFSIHGFANNIQLKGLISEITNSKLRRNGDMCADPNGSFEAPINPKQLQTFAWNANGTTYVAADSTSLHALTLPQGEEEYTKCEDARNYLATRITFDTPDPYINTLGGALTIAADGIWDEKTSTWMHGAVGWRMPLAGWRAAYSGDVLGWNYRAIEHFDAYAASQVIGVPCTICHPTQDTAQNMSRAVEKWGTPMYSNGYICRNPKNNKQMHHYDMNLNYIDELLWHFCWNSDTVYMRKMWPVIKRHLAWEKMNYDPDNDGLYDAYCCIWASDALYYNSGAVTHSSAYNYRANKLAARIAEILGEDGKQYKDEADKILSAMNSRLWIPKNGCWAEYQDFMGLKRKHESVALWTVYTAIDCGACSEEQAYEATRYIDTHIPHIPVTARGLEDKDYSTVSTTNWMPYSWSINNVASAEVMHTALAYFEAGRSDEGFRLMKSNILDQMYIGDSPANFGQISFYDAARGECYRDFGDNIGISSRTLINGLFGVLPDALYDRCIIRPGFPSNWKHAKFTSPYLIYTFNRIDTAGVSSRDIYTIVPKFLQPLNILLKVKMPYQNVKNVTVNDKRTDYRLDHISGEVSMLELIITESGMSRVVIEWGGDKAQKVISVPYNSLTQKKTEGCDFNEIKSGDCRMVNIDKTLNANVSGIFNNRYLSPLSPYTTLRIPVQGIGEWCHPKLSAYICDSVLRSMVKKNILRTSIDIPFRSFNKGNNIAYTSLWDNYPDSVVILIKGKASHAYLLMAGSTNHMQSRIDNGIIVITYQNGSTDSLHLVNPDNWCPIEQDYYVDGKAFNTPSPRPYRIHFGSGIVSRDLGRDLNIKGVYGREIPSGAGEILDMPLDNTKNLKSLTVRTLSNDVVIGLMGLTLQK